MKTNYSISLAALSLLAVTCVLLSAPASKASLAYHVTINTASLVGNVNGPFLLDFQLNDGSGTLAVPNTVTISNFSFTGGSATGAANLFGGVTGSLGSTVSLTDGANFSNEFFQAFTVGTTKIGFDVLMTTNVDPGPTPDAFSVAILDKNLFNIPTTGLGDSLLLVNINSATLPLSAVQTFTSLAPTAGVSVAVAAVPEPGTALAGVLMVGLCGAVRRRRA